MYQKRLHSCSLSCLIRTFNSISCFYFFFFFPPFFPFFPFLSPSSSPAAALARFLPSGVLAYQVCKGKGACLREFPETLQLQKSSVAQSKYRNLASKIRRYVYGILRCWQLVSFMQLCKLSIFVHIIISSSVVQPQCMVRYMAVNLYCVHKISNDAK